MKTEKSLLFVLPLIALVLMACSINIGNNINLKTVKGSGDLETEERTVSDFDQVSLSGVGTLNIVQGDEETLTIEAEDNLMEYITTEVRGSTLEIGIKDGVSIFPTKEVTYNLTVKDLSAISVSGFANVKADTLKADTMSLTVSGTGNMNIKDLQATRITVNSSGAGNFNLAGAVENQDVTISGTGNYDAEDLESQTVSLKVSGAGNTQLWVTDDLDVQISGFGSVSYYGDPDVSKTISGGGSVKSLGEHK